MISSQLKPKGFLVGRPTTAGWEGSGCAWLPCRCVPTSTHSFQAREPQPGNLRGLVMSTEFFSFNRWDLHVLADALKLYLASAKTPNMRTPAETQDVEDAEDLLYWIEHAQNQSPNLSWPIDPRWPESRPPKDICGLCGKPIRTMAILADRWFHLECYERDKAQK